MLPFFAEAPQFPKSIRHLELGDVHGSQVDEHCKTDGISNYRVALGIASVMMNCDRFRCTYDTVHRNIYRAKMKALCRMPSLHSLLCYLLATV